MNQHLASSPLIWDSAAWTKTTIMWARWTVVIKTIIARLPILQIKSKRSLMSLWRKRASGLYHVPQTCRIVILRRPYMGSLYHHHARSGDEPLQAATSQDNHWQQLNLYQIWNQVRLPIADFSRRRPHFTLVKADVIKSSKNFSCNNNRLQAQSAARRSQLNKRLCLRKKLLIELHLRAKPRKDSLAA